MVSSLQLWFCAFKTATLGPKLHVCMDPRPQLQYCACKIESQACMGPSPHLWVLHTKQRLLDPNNKSLWVPDITCRFAHAIQRD